MFSDRQILDFKGAIFLRDGGIRVVEDHPERLHPRVDIAARTEKGTGPNGTVVAKKNALTSGDRSDRASGNGSIMRLAPVPIHFVHYYPQKIEELSRLAEESSLPTHASEQCLSTCRYLATVLAAPIHGEDRVEILSSNWKPLQLLNDIKPLHPLIQEIAQGSFRQKQPPAIQGSGWVVKSLEASLWAFHNAESVEDAVLKAVNLATTPTPQGPSASS